MRRPTPATVIAVIALVVAMAGGAYATLRAPKNSVVSRSIRNGQVKRADLGAGAVNGAKIADGSVSGADIQDGAVGAGDLAPGAVAGEATTTIAPNPQASTDPCDSGQAGVFCGIATGTPTPGYWVNVGSGFAPGAFFRDPQGVVHLSGLVKVAYPTSPQRILTLPTGYRPDSSHVFNSACWTTGGITAGSYYPCQITVQADGGVIQDSPGKYPGSGLSLDGISFRAG